MATFKDYAITDSGRILKSHVDVGATFIPTRVVVGSGYIPVGKTARTMTAVVTPIKSLAVNKAERTPDGKVIFGGMYDNSDITEAFYFRELALYAKAVYPDGTEVDEALYCYGNGGDDAEYMAAYSTSTVVERQLDLVTYIGNDAVVNLTIASGVYASLDEFRSHAERHKKGGEDAITPADIGAAPSGFGYGDIVAQISATSATQSVQEFCQAFDEILDDMTSFPMTKQVGTSVPWAFGSGYYLATIYKYSAQYSVVIGYSSPISASAYGWRVTKDGSIWSEVEWINAPMRLNVEYRTTERIDGKVVYKKNVNGVIQYRLEGETAWKTYAKAVGAVDKSGDTVNGNLSVNGAFTVERSDNNRKARTVVHNNADKEADFQNYTDDSNYVGIRLATEVKGAGDAAQVVHMKNGQFASFPLLHTGNKEKIFTSGTEDLVAGVTPLGTGQLYFVYE